MSFRLELERISAGKAPETPLFADLARIVLAHGLPLRLFHDLLDAFGQDVVKNRYADFGEVLDYSRRSANPVGRLLLQLFGKNSPENCALSDRICSALQLINFWQDVGIDYETKNRIYLPQDEMRRFGVGEAHLRQHLCDAAFQALMRFQVDRARAMMLEGMALLQDLQGRFRLEIAITVQGGLRILERLERAHYDMFRHRPTHQWLDWSILILRALKTRAGPVFRS
jgi:squalene synthase HpnC